MSAEEECFILLVQKYRELYDSDDKNYRNIEVRDNCWAEISETMEMPVPECKKKWKKLRDCFRKTIKNRKTKSGEAIKKIRPWRLEHEMAFLLPYIDEEAHMTNVPSPASEATEELHDDCEDLEGDEKTSRSESLAVPPSYQTCQSKLYAADVFSKYLQDKQSKKSASNTISSSDDSITTFFLSMAETVRNLPKDLQIQVKSDFFKILTDAELVAFQRSQGSMPMYHFQSADMLCPETKPNVRHQQSQRIKSEQSPHQTHLISQGTCEPYSGDPLASNANQYSNQEKTVDSVSTQNADYQYLES